MTAVPGWATKSARGRIRRATAVVGVGQTDWVSDYRKTRSGEKPNDSYGYALSAFAKALKDANISKESIDGLIVGPTTAYERVGELAGIDARWGAQCDAALSVIQACIAIESGLAEVVALVYGNDQRSAGTQYGGPQAMGGDYFLSYIYHSPWGLTSQGALYALSFRAFMAARNMTERDLGEVAVAQRKWSALNEKAIMRKGITLEEYMASPYVCEPLRRLDYCLINDGGVALIIAEAERAKQMTEKPVFIEGLGRFDSNQSATSLMPRVTEFTLPAQQACSAQLFNMAGIGPKDIDTLQVYDSFSVHIPYALEGNGYCAVGEAGRFLREEGIGPNDRLPTNTAGGHLSESYMQGWGHQIECVRQLRGESGNRQVADCRFAHYSSAVAGKAVSIIYSR